MSLIASLWLSLFGTKVADKPVTTCQWPNTCSVVAVNDGPIETCQMPNRCGI